MRALTRSLVAFSFCALADAQDVVSSDPPYAQPSDIEQQLLQFIAERQPAVLSINSVRCTPTECELAFTGTDTKPRFVDAQHNFNVLLHAEAWRDFKILTSGLGTREVAPGAREYVLNFTYQALVDLSADPETAARQHAACAASWRRMTTNPTPKEYVRQYLEIAEKYVTIAAAKLGREEAERIARETSPGPVIRQCGQQPP